MSNYKIRVNSEAESKEAQELFFELGYEKGACSTGGYPALIIATPESRFQKTPYSSRATSLNHEAHSQYKEITLPELRDLVVLKRNSIDDATHTDPNEKESLYFRLFGEWWNLFTGGKWQQFCHMYSPRADKLKPIEKPMKEYLRKNSNGTYSYIGMVRPEHVSDFMIEIPEGAEIYIDLGFRNHSFYKDNFKLCWCGVRWENTVHNSMNLEHWNNTPVLWKRHTNPEELPFIDDECYTNKSDGGFRLPNDEPSVDTYKSEFGIEPPISLNDQYAEIEKVRQSHRTASEIADSALKHIRERAETYDQPTGERSAAKTAKAFNAITGKDITESEVWLLLQLLKDVRQWSREDYHQDSAEDCIAYAALKAESLESEK